MNNPATNISRPFVLSGGGARGYAHLGVLKAFAEQHIFPEAISATSAGSIAAAFICDGYNTDEVREIFATNFLTGDQTIFSEGALIPAVLAASSVPLLFPPVEIGGTQYVDGGLSGNLPIEPLLGQYRDIIGVHVNPLTPYNPANGFLANVERTLHLAIREPVLKNKLLCSRFIEPEALGRFGMFEFNRLEDIYTVGLEHTRHLLESAPAR
ncbi:patatin-like phospholipase family protein [Chitinophaga sp. 22321]|uniref:Patatin-like phospholipase family protein n=1 Tax=Chitinophaga hostae TaxID=2831022 RepID=A0ABS5IXN2_9BACT|nr:patatin-like phospholipase family protein [Chitinophaga hostae]MBS0027728.1 patatin-like phospholipase family protein [Chitinophaga hostae]